ncbi:CDP-alcohol phosphatidyltransferase family protein [Dehalococcoidia bacterium]|nr:CDP-alcohol phosphatidyltransferase family protein [Dehalococcoidia bacterium]
MTQLLGLSQVRKEFSTRIITPVVVFLGRLGLTPNTLTLFGFVIAGMAAFLASIDHLWAAGLVTLSSSVFDTLDGGLARATDKVTRFGALLDSVVDRMSEALVLLGLLVHYLSHDHTLGAILVYLAFMSSVMVSYLRSRSEGLGVDCKVGVMTRPERVVVLSIGLVAGHWAPNLLLTALVIITVFSFVTSVHRTLYTRSVLDGDE